MFHFEFDCSNTSQKIWTKISWRNKTGYKKEQCLQIVELFQKTVLQCSSVVKTHSSPTVHNLTKNLKKNLEKSLRARDETDNQYWMLAIF